MAPISRKKQSDVGGTAGDEAAAEEAAENGAGSSRKEVSWLPDARNGRHGHYLNY